MTSNDKILTLDEVADLLKISKPTIYRGIKSGKIPAQKVGRSWRFLKSDLLNLLKPTRKRTNISGVSPQINFEEIAKLCQKDYIALVYLFGSAAEGTADRQSDVDIGIVFLPNVKLDKRHFLFSKIKDDFARCIEKFEIDLIFLQEVGPLVQEQAILGSCIYAICNFFQTRYEDRVSREALDFRFFQKRFDQEMIEEIKEGRFFVA